MNPFSRHDSWKIVYSRFDGPERRAVELANTELARRILREGDGDGAHRLHILPCEREGGEVVPSPNAFVVGTWDESALVRRFVREEEIPAGGYLLKVVDAPDAPGASLVLATARAPEMLLPAVAAFFDDYASGAARLHGAIRYPDRILSEGAIPPRALASAPATATRGVFAWGHTVNDYRAYFRMLARLRLNQAILWNDHVPVNARDVIDCAHSYGIEVLFGYAWGWIDGCSKIKDIGDGVLAEIHRRALDDYERHYLPLGCDGIYFQSFTERSDAAIGGRGIAAAVTGLVNDTAGELLRRHPGLRIQFGLHAQSVRDHLDDIARVDPRVEILWEDCGAFPYAYLPVVADEAEFDKALAFTDRILALRPGGRTGLVLKGLMTQDWTCGRFVNQRGPYLLGENPPEVAAHDRRVRADGWRMFAAEWIRYGEYALRLVRHVRERAPETSLYCAALLEPEVELPSALLAEIFWGGAPGESWPALVERVAKRPR